MRNLLARIEASCARSQPCNSKRAGLVLRSLLGFGEGTIVAHIEGARPRSWQHVLWLLMTAAGVLLLIYAALYV